MPEHVFQDLFMNPIRTPPFDTRCFVRMISNPIFSLAIRFEPTQIFTVTAVLLKAFAKSETEFIFKTYEQYNKYNMA